MKKKAVILSSGGIDSTTVMFIARSRGYKIYSLSLNYGQRHFHELAAAKRVAAAVNAEKHFIIDVDLKKIGGSALTDAILVPKGEKSSRKNENIPVTYVPARNTIFLSIALAWAEVIRSSEIFIGVNAVDYSGYPDCRSEYIKAFENMANLATKFTTDGHGKIKIITPLINLTKAEIITKGTQLGVDYSITQSCYDPSPDGFACGLCDSCIFRKQGFKEAGISDPTNYI